jgi:hypothetical protein
MLRHIEVRPLPGYKIHLQYADGVAGEVDLCADALYMQITGKTAEEVFSNIAKAALHA